MNSISLCMLIAVELTRKISPRLSHDPYRRAFCFLSCSMLGENRLEENCKSFFVFTSRCPEYQIVFERREGHYRIEGGANEVDAG